MKKIKGILMGMLMLFLLTGCGKELTAEVGEKMNNLESGEVIYNLDMTMNAEGMELSVPIDMTMKFYKEEKIYIDMTTSILGQSVAAEMYGVVSGDNMTLYTKSAVLGDDWYKMSGPVAEAEVADVNVFVDLYDKLTNLTKLNEKDLAKDIVAYKATLSAKDANELLNSSGTDYDFELANDLEIKTYLNEKTNYIDKMVLDFGEGIEIEEEGTKFDVTMVMTITFKSLNEINDIELPAETANAIDMN